MPRLNDAGQATPQIGYWWFDQSRWIFQDCDSGTCRIALSDGTLIAPMPCVRLIANGHRVWAFVEYVKGQDPTLATYRDSFGRVLTNAYPVAIGPDGAICVKPHSNIGARVLEPDGREWILSEDDAQDVQLLGHGRALFTVRGVPQANIPLVGNPGVPVWWARVTDDGLLLYQSQQTGELVLGGKVIAPPSANYFSPDVRLIDGEYVVCWSPSQNDTNAQFLRLTPAQLAALPSVGTLPAPPAPIPVPQPKPEPVPMPDIPSQIHLVEAIRAKYPRRNPGGFPLGEDAPWCIVEIAKATKTLVFRKDSGENCRIPAGLLSKYPDGVSINRTIIGRGAFGNQWVKVLGDGENTAFPKWETGDTPADGEYVDVSEIVLPGQPPPTTPPPTNPPSGQTLEQRVSAIEAWIRRAL